MNTDNNTTEFSADELAFISSRGEDAEALGRAYGPGGAASNDDEDNPPRHPGMEQEEKPNGSQKAQNGAQKVEDEEGDDDDADDENGSQRSQYVPHGQFHKERSRRHAAETEAAELKVKMARAEERLAILNEFMQGGGQQQNGQGGQPNGQQQAKSAWDEADIDPTEDFEAAMLQLRRRQQEDRAARDEWQQKSDARSQEGQQAQAYVQSAVAYARQNPTFAGAYRHLMQTYHQELQAYGMTDQAERNNHIRQEEKKLAKFALENGQNPAEVIMSLAQARGFAPPQQQEEREEEEATDAPSLADAAKQVKGRVESIKKAKKSTGTLSNAGGGAKNELTMDQMLSMSDDEFFEKVHKLPLSKRKKLIAG